MLRTALWALPMLLFFGSNAFGQTTATVPDSVPALEVFEGTSHPPGIHGIHAENGRVDFGAARVGQVVSKVFTVKNVGFTPVTLSDSIKLPAGFTQMRRFGKTTLAPGESTTVVVALNSARPGRLGGQAALRSKNGQDNLFRFHVTGSALAPPSMRILSLSDVGFRTLGKWVPVTTSGKNALASVAEGGKGKELATWTFSGLQPGSYIVSATWPASNKAAANAPFTVLNGSKPFKSIR